VGESAEDRAGLIHALATLPAHPESVPINALVRIEGTPQGLAQPCDLGGVRSERLAGARRLTISAILLRPGAGVAEHRAKSAARYRIGPALLLSMALSRCIAAAIPLMSVVGVCMGAFSGFAMYKSGQLASGGSVDIEFPGKDGKASPPLPLASVKRDQIILVMNLGGGSTSSSSELNKAAADAWTDRIFAAMAAASARAS
jgi:hypothetical protein